MTLAALTNSRKTQMICCVYISLSCLIYHCVCISLKYLDYIFITGVVDTEFFYLFFQHHTVGQGLSAHGVHCWIGCFQRDVSCFTGLKNNRKDNGNIDIASTDAFHVFPEEVSNVEQLSFCPLSCEEVSSLFLAFKRC